MLEAEKGVIGCVLIDNDVLFKVYNILKPNMMSTEFCSDCYSEMLAMYDHGDVINIMTLSQNLECDKWDAEYIGNALKECVLSSPMSEMIKSYADTIIKEWKARTVKELISRVSLQPKDIDDTILELRTRLDELQENEQAKSKTMKQIVEENKDKHFNADVGKDRIRLGFYNLDEATGGLEGGDIMVIGARPAVGKSAIVAQMIANVASKGKKVGYFNLEMSDAQVYERFVSKESQIDLTRVRRAKAFLGEEESKYNAANEKLSKMRVIVSTNCRNVSTIKAECRHQGFDLIVIDYLQLMKSDKKYTNRVNEVGDISKSVKELAMELNVPIILLSQLNRVSEQKNTKEPEMSELREAGDIEQDASIIFLMWNASEKDAKYKGGKCCKNRMGITMKEGITFEGEHMEFKEWRDDWDKYEIMIRNLDGNSPDYSRDITKESNNPFGEDW